MTNTRVFALAIDPTTPQALYAGTRGGGVYKSTDGGGHWNAINAGLPHTDVLALAIDPATPQRLYAGTFGGVFDLTQVAAPEIQVLDGATDVPDGTGSVNFGPATAGTPIDKTFTVNNTGTADLTLTEPITVPAGFSVANSFGSTTVSAGNSTTFTVRFDAATAGTYSGTLQFANNDGDENPFHFTITATGRCPAVSGPFATVWAAVQDAIGCASGSASTGFLAEENFEGGKMFWPEAVDQAQVLVLFNDGTWQAVEHAPFVEGSPDFSCPDADTPSLCPPTPKRGFGMVWCDVAEVRSGLGNAIDCERGYQSFGQPFERGFMLQTDDGAIYVFYDDGRWERRGVAITPDNAAQVVPLARLGRGGVREVAYSPDGTLLAVASSLDIYLYETETLEEVRCIETKGWVRGMAFSPDGATLASALSDSTVQLWRVSDGSLQRTLAGHTDPVYSVAFSPDGATLASGSDDNTVRLWRVSNGRLQHTLKGHTDPVYSVAFSPDGATLASASWDETVQLWQVSDGILQRTLEGHTNWVLSVAFSPDGTTLASGGGYKDPTVRLWRVSDGTLLRTLAGHTAGVSTWPLARTGRCWPRGRGTARCGCGG